MEPIVGVWGFGFRVHTYPLLLVLDTKPFQGSAGPPRNTNPKP